MRIGVIADTHIPKMAKTLPIRCMATLAGVDMIIHAGDLVEEIVLEQLEEVAPVVAVHGNRDSESLKKKLLDKKIIEVNGFRIGVIHGHGERGTTMQRLPSFFKGIELDCIIFGHSHIPYNSVISGVLYFNPGSPTVKKRQKYASMGILTLGDTIDAQIVYFD